jgi:restriction system protein
LAQLNRAMGHTATLTPHSSDEGVDILLEKGGKTFVVQCKAHRKAVGPSTIRELYGTLIASGADGAILASVSGFTAGVVRYVQDKPIELVSLNDIVGFQRLIEARVAGEGLSFEEASMGNSA